MKTVLITGSSRGIGLEFCRQYAKAGWRILACARNPSEELKALSGKYPLVFHSLDVSNWSQIEALGKTISKQSIDILINNAGIYPDSGESGFGQANREKWIRAFEVNTMAPLKLAETLIKQIERSEGRRIVTLTSKMGSVSDNKEGGSYLYRSSKAASNMVVKSMSIDLKPYGIIAAALHPGWVKTAMGGPHALISVEESVSGMMKVIESLKLSDSGRFFAYDGAEVPW